MGHHLNQNANIRKRQIFLFMGGHNFWEGLYDSVNIAFIRNLVDAGLMPHADLLMTTIIESHLSPELHSLLEHKENELKKILHSKGVQITYYHVKARDIRGLSTAIKELKQIIKSYDHRFIWAQNYFNSFIGNRLKKALEHTHLHFDMRGLVPQEELYYSSSNIFSRITKFFVLSVLERTNLKQADSFTVVSDRFSDYIHKKYKLDSKPYVVFPNYYEENKFYIDPQLRDSFRKKYQIKVDQKLILYSGMLQKWQDPDLIFGFIKQIQDQDKDNKYRFMILTYDVEKASHFAVHFGIKDLIIDNADGESLNGVYNAADIGLAFRDHQIASIVSCPVKIPEYLASGNSLISLEFIGDFGHDLAMKKYALIKKSREEALNISLAELESLQKPSSSDLKEIKEMYSFTENFEILKTIING